MEDPNAKRTQDNGGYINDRVEKIKIPVGRFILLNKDYPLKFEDQRRAELFVDMSELVQIEVKKACKNLINPKNMRIIRMPDEFHAKTILKTL